MRISVTTYAGMGGAHEPQLCQIKLIDEEIDDTDQVILIDPVLKPIRKQHCLPARHTFDET